MGGLLPAALMVFLLLFFFAFFAPADAAGDGLTPATDPVLARLIGESLSARPELKAAQAQVSAQRERAPQAVALPDPSLSLGIQNDGFTQIAIGEMETSYLSIMWTQPVPWPGKRKLRGEIAELGVKAADLELSRYRLSAEADVRRAYLALMAVRDRLQLLARTEALWHKSEGIVRARYEAGQGAQSDLLRAQLELRRLAKRRLGLEAEERRTIQMLNRLRDRPLDEPIETASHLADLVDPLVLPFEAELEDARSRSPELGAARLAVRRGDRAVALAEAERYPDLSFTAGVMPRGDMEPMWQLGVSAPLPIFGKRKQARAVAEMRLQARASEHDATGVAQVLAERVAQRRTALVATLAQLGLYRDGLLVQAEATLESTLAQYQVGSVPFFAVLEATLGLIGDQEGHLATIAALHDLAIARAEVSLEPVPGSADEGMSGQAMPRSQVQEPAVRMTGGSMRSGRPQEAPSSPSRMTGM